ncbi:MAG: hypothetical protein P4L90_11885 [Rhodopila sp.]|nr:hypothetical protein [Rhodopila sp.]
MSGAMSTSQHAGQLRKPGFSRRDRGQPLLRGSGDIVSLSGGANTVSDTGGGNGYVLPAAGKGTATFKNDPGQRPRDPTI